MSSEENSESLLTDLRNISSVKDVEFHRVAGDWCVVVHTDDSNGDPISLAALERTAEGAVEQMKRMLQLRKGQEQ